MNRLQTERELRLVEDEIDFAKREMSQIIITQSDLDSRLTKLDKRRNNLEHKKAKLTMSLMEGYQ